MKRRKIASGTQLGQDPHLNLLFCKDVHQLVFRYLGCNSLFNAIRINRNWYHKLKAESCKNKKALLKLLVNVPSCVQKADIKHFYSQVVQGIISNDGNCAYISRELKTSITVEINQRFYFNLLRLKPAKTSSHWAHIIPESVFIVSDHDRLKNCFAIRYVKHSKTFACVTPLGEIELTSSKHLSSMRQVIEATAKELVEI
jgi:hypothetical protein